MLSPAAEGARAKSFAKPGTKVTVNPKYHVFHYDSPTTPRTPRKKGAYGSDWNSRKA